MADDRVLPPGLEAGADPVRLLAHLRERGGAALRAVTLAERVERLGTVGERMASGPLRDEAIDRVRVDAGYSRPMAEAVVDGMARDWTRERLDRLVRADFPDPEALDAPRPPCSPRPSRPGSGADRVRGVGDGLALHIVSGSVPGVGATSLIRSLLVGSPLLLKPGRGDRALPLLFARTLAEVDTELAEAVAVVYWPGGQGAAFESEALQRADRLVVYGGRDTVEALRSRLPAGTPLVEYPHRVSVAMIGRGALAERPEELADRAARAVALFDQRGCVSPHAIWVESGPEVGAWVEELARACARWAERLPPGPLEPTEADRIRQARAEAELTAAVQADDPLGARLYAGDELAWTVVLDPDPALRPTCLGRTARVKPVDDLREAVRELSGHRTLLQSVGLEVDRKRRDDLTEALARVGATRITTLERQPWPPAWWRHDGRGPLEALVRWASIED